nr:MAG TPA: hypothetical protein [Caudoviricetes sp.]
MTIYIDNDYKCHIADDGTMTAIEADAFNGKGAEYIKGYRYVPAGQTWTREDGVEFSGEMIAPWKPWSELDAAQREYERQQITQYESALTEIEAALGVTS